MEPLYILSCVAVNCYVMITGYFLITKMTLRWNGIIKTWLQTFFYSVLFLSMAFCLDGKVVLADVKKSLLPIYFEHYWFVVSYIGLLLVAPFLSRIVSTLNKQQYQLVLGILFVLCFQFLYGRVYAGFSSLAWFSFLYLTAGYLRLYGIPAFWIKHNKLIFITVWLTLCVLASLVNVMHGTQFELISSAYDGPMFFLSLSVFIMFLCSECDIPIFHLLTKMAPYTFGVYLVHENLFVSKHIWEIVVPNHFVIDPFLTCLLTCSLIFMIGIIIDYIRKKMFDYVGVDKFVNTLQNKLPNL